jgi:Phage gp6-like head-tail connector protein
VTTYDLGDTIPLQHRVYSNGALTAATVALTVTAPDGTTTTPSVTTSTTGVYNATVATDQVGLWSYVWSVSGAVPDDEAPGQFTIATRAPLAYASLYTVRLALGINNDNSRDALIESACEAASRFIDDTCGRRFYADTTTSARTYRLRGRCYATDEGEALIVDDIASATGLAVAIGSGASYTTITDYETAPDNAIVRGQPITDLIRTASRWSGYGATARVRVTARWGWPAIPDAIAEATKIQAARLFRRKDSPEGVLASPEWGAVRMTRIDPDVEALIRPYVLAALA